MKIIQEIYKRIKKEYLDAMGYDVPERYRSSFVHWGGSAEVQYIYRCMLKGLSTEARILIVGLLGGRDFFLLRNLGFNVTGLDIGLQPDIEGIVLANIEDSLSFADESFDAVLIGEVLEHLCYDIHAIENLRRVLKKDGRFIVSLPFYNDWEEGHMRVHSPKSGERLLNMGGFDVQIFIERPGIISPNFLNPVQHGISLVSFVLTGKTAYSWLTNLIGWLSWKLGQLRWLRPIRRLSRHYGGYYLALKSVSKLDYLAINMAAYTIGKNKLL